MSTRGLVGFHVNGIDHLSYNHSDSYPGGLGLDVLAFCKQNSTEAKLATLKRRAARLKKAEGVPTPEAIKQLEPWTDLCVSKQSTEDWYCLLRLTQGDLDAILRCGYMQEDNEFILDSLFCEWAFIINLDSGKLECYKVFQEKEHKLGRYSIFPPKDGRYACALVAEFSLRQLPSEKTFLEKLKEDEEED